LRSFATRQSRDPSRTGEPAADHSGDDADTGRDDEDGDGNLTEVIII
jgi:hypothetical protein